MFKKKFDDVPDGEGCPDLGGHPCIKRKCKAWQFVQGKDPQTGADLSGFMCVKYDVEWRLQVDLIRKENETGAAVEHMRNEMIKSVDSLSSSIQKAAAVAAIAAQISLPHGYKMVNGEAVLDTQCLPSGS